MADTVTRKSLLQHSMEGGVWLGLYLIVRFAFMVMGLERAMLYADTAKAVKAAYFISDDGRGGYKVDQTMDMALFLEE